MTSQFDGIGRMVVGDEPEGPGGSCFPGEEVEGTSEGGGVGLRSLGELHFGASLEAFGCDSTGLEVTSGIGSVDESGPAPDGGTDPDPELLGEFEGFEVIVDDGFEDEGDLVESMGLEEESVSSEAVGTASDGGLGAVEGACELTVGGSGLESCGDGCGEGGMAEVVGGGEGLS